MLKVLFIIFFMPSVVFAADILQVAETTNDLQIKLSDGKSLKLQDIYIPESYAERALQLINDFTKYGVSYENSGKTGRYGDILSYIYNKEGLFLQEELLKKGYAVIYTKENAEKLATYEKLSILSKSGIWGDNSIVVTIKELTANPDKYRNKFVITEGVVYTVKKSKEFTYINFDKDWKTDFTAGISNENKRNFPKDFADNLTGKKILLKGWISSYNGPFMEIYGISDVIIN